MNGSHSTISTGHLQWSLHCTARLTSWGLSCIADGKSDWGSAQLMLTSADIGLLRGEYVHYITWMMNMHRLFLRTQKSISFQNFFLAQDSKEPRADWPWALLLHVLANKSGTIMLLATIMVCVLTLCKAKLAVGLDKPETHTYKFLGLVLFFRARKVD